MHIIYVHNFRHIHDVPGVSVELLINSPVHLCKQQPDTVSDITLVLYGCLGLDQWQSLCTSRLSEQQSNAAVLHFTKPASSQVW